MKKIISLAIAIILVLSTGVFYGCGPSKAEINEETYMQAKQILGIEDAKEDDVLFIDFINYNGNSSIDEITSAMEALKALGDYKDSAELAEMAEIYLKRKEAISYFTQGDFESALPLFKEIQDTYGESADHAAQTTTYKIDNYITGIEYMLKVVGTWEADYGRYDLNTVTCTIGAPFSIEPSPYSDCIWVVTGNIKIEVEKYASTAYDSQIFTINKTDGFHYYRDDNELSDSIMIKHEKFKQQIFDSSRSGYSMIDLKPNDNYLPLTELIYSTDWTTVRDSNSVDLRKVS